MNDALYIAATGMHGQQLAVDTISNNLANVNTPGFKRSRVNFHDLIVRTTATEADEMSSAVVGYSKGAGVGVSDVAKMFTPGEIRQTSLPLDVAIRGAGFFSVALPDGGQAYTRSGVFQVNKDGLLTTSTGYVVKPLVVIGRETRDLTIQADGTVLGATGADNKQRELGRIELAMFNNTSALAAEGDGLFRSTEASGEAIFGKPGVDSFGSLVQASLEFSNVNLVDEMVSLMIAQRAYGLNAKLAQTADEMMAMSNNLRK